MVKSLYAIAPERLRLHHYRAGDERYQFHLAGDWWVLTPLAAVIIRRSCTGAGNLNGM